MAQKVYGVPFLSTQRALRWFLPHGQIRLNKLIQRSLAFVYGQVIVVEENLLHPLPRDSEAPGDLGIAFHILDRFHDGMIALSGSLHFTYSDQKPALCLLFVWLHFGDHTP